VDIRVFVLFLAGLFSAVILMPVLAERLEQSGAVRADWQGRPIITAGGLIFLIILGLAFGPLWLMSGGHKESVIYPLAAAAIALIGLHDDWRGDPGVKGIGGHLHSLRAEKKVTTGLIKAAGSGLICLWLLLELGRENLFLDWLLLVLSINYVNLLDLRPGRAIKGFLLVYLPLAGGCLYSPTAEFSFVRAGFLAIGGGAVIGYAPHDFKGLVMLGDTGSNTLGFLVGLALLAASPATRAVMCLSMILLHLAAENYSISRIIAGNGWLDRLDRWGRE